MSENENKDKSIDPYEDSFKNLSQSFLLSEAKSKSSVNNTNKKPENESPSSNEDKDKYLDKRYI